MNTHRKCSLTKSNKECRHIYCRNNQHKNVTREQRIEAEIFYMWLSKTRRRRKLDPFQVFEVDHENCLDLKITIHKGSNITKGSSFSNFFDTPDPYVVLKIPESANYPKITKHVNNSSKPVWEEVFHFYLDPKENLILEVSLMDANITVDECLGKDTIGINHLPRDIVTKCTFAFPGGSQVHASLLIKTNDKSDLRFSLALCDEEQEYLEKRKELVYTSMQKLLGNRAPSDITQVPVIGVIGSGGGYRAMLALSGSVKALHESGLLDCATYISGLSGSAWYLSTLYSHEKFPEMSHYELQQGLKETVTRDWKIFMVNSLNYMNKIIKKYGEGQPVSFTDFFASIIGDTLLKHRKKERLSHQQKALQEAEVPLPLYAALHAKETVSCRTFSEWVEFSPYEIGIAKYGIFMKTEHFGSKFIVGKLSKQFPEPPLYFLQGLWGSAFSILFKRLVNRNPQTLRECDLNDEFDKDMMKGSDTKSKDEVDCSTDQSTSRKKKFQASKSKSFDSGNDTDEKSHPPLRRSLAINNKSDVLIKKSQSTESFLRDDTFNANQKLSFTSSKLGIQRAIKGDGFDYIKTSDNSASIINSNKISSTIYSSPPNSSKLGRKGAIRGGESFDKTNLSRKSPSSINSSKLVSNIDSSSTTIPKLGRKGAFKGDTSVKSATENFRESRRIRRIEKGENKGGFLAELKKNLMTGSKMFDSRSGRAGEILNPFRGLSIRNTFPISPFTETCQEEDEDAVDYLGTESRYHQFNPKAKTLFVVDAGLAFNSPYPLLLRPQRGVELYISYEQSLRATDRTPCFSQLILAEKWAIHNKVPFPPIEKQVVQYEGESNVGYVREVYVFKKADDPTCPVVLHFPLVNHTFRTFKAPGIERETDEEFNFANFKIFDDKNEAFSSTNFIYQSIQVDRLMQLTEYNTLNNMDLIKDEIAAVIQKKRQQFGKVENIVDMITRAKRLSRRYTKKRLHISSKMKNNILEPTLE